ncbi:MAG: VCBS repeat-containing protein, partial [Planctomycetota bacterium]
MRALHLTGTLVLVACGAEEGTPTAPTPSSTAAPFHFVDVTAESGLGAFRQVSGSAGKPFINESFGAGVALFDVDGDGDLDAYLTNGSTQAAVDSPESEKPADALYLNDGSGHFEDATLAAGLGDRSWTYGVTVGDYDGDGHPDLYLTNDGPNRLYRNRGDGTFEDVTAAMGVGGAHWSTGATFLDYDRDGDLDLYVANHIAFDRASIALRGLRETYFDVDVYYGPGGLDAVADVLYRNDGEHFTDVSQESGIAAVALYGFHVVSFDHDQDGWPDIYVAND